VYRFGGNKMMLRMNGPLPHGKFEYTCDCGNQSFEKIEGNKEIIKYKCSGCGLEILLKDQGNHYHIFITK